MSNLKLLGKLLRLKELCAECERRGRVGRSSRKGDLSPGVAHLRSFPNHDPEDGGGGFENALLDILAHIPSKLRTL